MRRAILFAIAAVVVIGALWEATYSDPFDPKNPHYVAWKWHLLPIDPMRALSIMPADRRPDHLVLGKNRQELDNRFGFTKTIAEVGTYLRDYCAAARPGAEVLFLNNSNLMVVMTNHRVSELVVCKG